MFCIGWVLWQRARKRCVTVTKWILLVMVLFFRPCQKNSNDCPYKENRCYPNIQPFKCVKSDSRNGGFRISIVPTQVGTVEYD